jgi:hypothetical protein
LNEDLFQAQSVGKTFKCKTCIQEGYFTLDNAKFWYLNFYYNFMTKCLDMNRIHVVELDTDSCYLAIAGNPNEDHHQCFKYVINDEDFYNEHIYSWAPSSFYSTNNTNPSFDTPKAQMAFDKKLLGLAIEKECENMIALAPKLYTCFNTEDACDKVISRKVKGVSLRQNDIQVSDYKNTLLNKSVVGGSNTNLILHNNVMSKITMHKNAITASHTKYRVLNDFSTCAPLIRDVTYEA